ncbi:MAG TPA: ATP-binding protein [Polyangiaceae bacterium]|nr:ATP-binding protein [Polyangiaceae bacterium]
MTQKNDASGKAADREPAGQEPPAGLDYRRLFESVPGLYLVLDLELRIIAVSDAYLEATLTVREQIIGRDIFDVFPDNPDDPAAAGVQNLRTSLEHVKAQRVPDSMPVQRYDVRRPDSEGGGFEQKYWSCVNCPVVAGDGALEYIIHRAEDVTEFMRLKQRGTETEQQTLELKQQAERMETEVIQRSLQVAETSRQLKGANLELARMNEKTRELDRLKTEFFANVSHELRTPLALILGPTKKLCDALDTPAPIRHDLEVVVRNARLLLRHVNDLLDISKLEAGKMSLERLRIDVADFVRLCAAHFETVADERDIRYLVQADGKLDAWVDPEKLQGVLLNLLSNAFKFTPSGGVVRCSLRREPGPPATLAIEVADAGPGIPPEQREAVFERFRQLEGGATRRVGGTGLGLAIAREFTELHGGTLRVEAAAEGGASFQVRLPLGAVQGNAAEDAAGAPAEAGASQRPAAEGGVDRGVNLDSVRRFALLNDAALAHVDSVAPTLVPGDEAPVPNVAPTAPLVLVVEDNPEMSQFIATSLKSNYRVARAWDGRAGFEQAIALRPAVVVTDVMMPEMDGEDLVRAIRQRPELATTQVLLLTAKADEAFRVRMLRHGAQDVLVKPFDVDELRARVENLTRSRKMAELAEANAQLAERFRKANIELENAYAELSSTQAQLIQAAKMASLGQLVAGVAHEINNPLSFVQSHLGTVLRNLDGMASEISDGLSVTARERWERVGDRLSGMSTGLDRIRELVLKLRTFSRLDEGERKRVSVRECVQSVLALLEHRLEGRIAVELGLDDEDVIDCYPALLNQALMNLLTNAIDAIDGSGKIAVLTRSRQDGYHIDVIDNGSGIPEPLRERVLEPFFTTRPVGQGTGLGLSITDSIIKKHGGWIELGDADGGGTRVTLHLPPSSTPTERAKPLN